LNKNYIYNSGSTENENKSEKSNLSDHLVNMHMIEYDEFKPEYNSKSSSTRNKNNENDNM
jgi:hypothetical protein